MDEARSWRAIPGFPGYEVSELAQVRGWRRGGKVLSPSTAAGPPQYVLYAEGERRYVYVVKIMERAFFPGGREGCRLVRRDVHGGYELSNLTWVSEEEFYSFERRNPGVDPEARMAHMRARRWEKCAQPKG